MHTIGIGRTTPHNSLACRLPLGGAGRNFAFVVGIARGQGETGSENSKTQNRRRTELPVHQGQAARSEKQEGQDITLPSHRLETEQQDAGSQTATPEHKSEAKNRPTFEDEASPLAFRK
jgi:hypothetical protein